MNLKRHLSHWSFLMSDYSRRWAIFVGVLLVLDGLVISGTLALAYLLRISSGLIAYEAPYDAMSYRALSLIGAPTWLILFAIFGLYQRDVLLGGITEYKLIVKACTGGTIALIVLSFLWRNLSQVSRGWLLLAWGMSCAFIILERFVARRLAYSLRRRGWFTARVLIVGANDQGIAIARQWSRSPTSGMQVVGFVDDFKSLWTPVVDGLKVLGRPTALNEIVRQSDANEVIVVQNAVAWETFEEIIARGVGSNGYTVRISPGFYEMLTTDVAVTNKTFVPLFTINEARIVGVDAALKAILDYGLGILLWALTAPLAGAIALALKLARPHVPVLDRHQAVGQGGVKFTMHKFHTGKAGNSNDSGTWLEQALYRSGLDKLPQLVNVLTGQMSLVGPRPRVIGEETDARAVRNLQTVKPGIIGPWTVAPFWMTEDEMPDELYYVRNWTIWLDLQILGQTIMALPSMRRLPRPAHKPRATPRLRAPVAPPRSPVQTSKTLALSKLGERAADSPTYQHYGPHSSVGQGR